MATNWYYVQNNDRVGPVDESEIKKLYDAETLNMDSYVWTKGFDNWKCIKDVDELKELLEKSEESIPTEIQVPEDVLPKEQKTETEIEAEAEKAPTFNWDSIDEDSSIFSIKIGRDRDGSEIEYGPFSLEMLKKLLNENRINGKTFIFTPGMENWSFLADIPIYELFFSKVPPVIEENDRRISIRKPFVAKMMFHDNSTLYEGICRDVSIGGLQVLVSQFPGQVGDNISLNVHPDNSEYSFVAEGKIVRILDGNCGFSMRFVDMNNEAEKAINSYVES